MERGKAVSGGESVIGTVFRQDFGQKQIAFEARLLQGRAAFAVVLVNVDARRVMEQKVLDFRDLAGGYHRFELELELRLVMGWLLTPNLVRQSCDWT